MNRGGADPASPPDSDFRRGRDLERVKGIEPAS